jgi:negative regulator of sigma E activity
MSGSHPIPETKLLNDQEREALSAYLDQELDAASSDAVTDALARRPEVRREADSLRKTWELLDYLPRPTAPPSFTEHTMTRLESTRGILLRQGARWRRFAIIGWVACVIIAAVFGFWLTYSSGQPEVQVIEAPVTDVIPAVDTSPGKIARKDRPETKIWQRLQREAIQQRNEKFRKEIRLLLVELQKKVSPDELKKLQAAGEEGGIPYMQMLFDLTRKYQIDVPLIVDRASKLPDKQPPGAVPTKTKK